jgi:flagellar FliL protein
MATSSTAPQQPAQPPAPPAPSSSKRTILIAAIVVVVIVLGAVIGLYFFLSNTLAPHAERKPPPPPAPIYLALDTMTVNLQSDDGELHYLRVGLSLKLADSKTEDELTQHMPEVRSRILLALSNKKPDELATLAGKRAVASELKTLIVGPIDQGGETAHVQEVLFTEFVVQ